MQRKHKLTPTHPYPPSPPTMATQFFKLPWPLKPSSMKTTSLLSRTSLWSIHPTPTKARASSNSSGGSTPAIPLHSLHSWPHQMTANSQRKIGKHSWLHAHYATPAVQPFVTASTRMQSSFPPLPSAAQKMKHPPFMMMQSRNTSPFQDTSSTAKKSTTKTRNTGPSLYFTASSVTSTPSSIPE